MSSYSFEDLKFKLKRRIKNFKIARSVIRINPFFNKFSYRAKIGKFRSYNSNDNILIIGCAGTIGSALAKQFKTKKANVYGTYFKTKPDPNTIPSQNTFQLDIRSSQSIYNLFEKIKNKESFFDLIIVATGYFPNSENENKINNKADRINLEKEQQEILNAININTIGPYLIFKSLLPLIRESEKGSKYISQFCVLTSSLGTMHNEIYGGLYPYRVSKGALHSIFLGVYCDVRHFRNIGILMAGPGSVKSKMNPFGVTSAEKSAKGIIKNLEFSSNKAKYQFLGLKGKRIPW
ncbi:MAG: SDR family NAD(P)-dependent oxidoreductase [Bacteroidota bacterium]|nr:SDR family NAD(P)-dependent oxidoreductase [Bacteroidota bacterium]